LKKGKAQAREKFHQHAQLATAERIIAAAKAQSAYYLAREPDKRPWAQTWLNQRRYQDDVESDPAPNAPTRKLTRMEQILRDMAEKDEKSEGQSA
jgi:hypothetical protein